MNHDAIDRASPHTPTPSRHTWSCAARPRPQPGTRRRSARRWDPRSRCRAGKFIQIELRLGDSTVMLADEFPDMGVLSPLSVGGTYGALHIATDNADALWERAVAAGATVHQPLAGHVLG